MSSDALRVVVDATTLVAGRTGIGLYTERVLRHWRALYPADRLILASHRPLDGVDDLDVDVVVQSVGLRAVWMQTALPALIAQSQPDISFFPNYLAPLAPIGRFAVTVHDLAIYTHAETFTFKKRILQQGLLPVIAARADAIVVPSMSTRRDLLRLLPADPARVVHTPLAADPRFSTPLCDDVAARVDAALALPERFILAVGTLEPRKNLQRLISAFEQIAPAAPDVALVLAGGKGWRDEGIRAALQASSARGRIHCTGYVDIDALQRLYERAEVLCYPSLYEGFGLPIVEAMACGTPVITSRGSSLDEVAGDAAIAVDPRSVEAIGAALLQVLGDASLRARLARLGRAQVASLHWDRTAAQTRAVVHAAARGRPLQPAADDAARCVAGAAAGGAG